MTSRSRGSGNGRAGAPAWRTLRTLLTMVLLAVVGCAQRDSADDGRRVERETPWQETIAQAKAFTYRIGFVPTANFTHHFLREASTQQPLVIKYNIYF